MDCPGCQAPNPDVARFCSSCGTALHPSCPQCGAATVSGDRFCGQCGATLGTAAPARDEPSAERRQVTVMFCDLVGSTAMSRALDPEDLRDVIVAYQDACRPVIQRFGGYLARYLGDGILIYFGYPQAHEDDAERAVHAALAIVHAVQRLPAVGGAARPAVRVGIATGLVVVGDRIGEGAAAQKAALGETPNLAARLQGEAGENEVVIDATTQRLAGRLFQYEALEGLSLKGFDTPVSGFRVLAESLDASRFEAIRSMVQAPLVGRDAELATLRERWVRAAAGHGQVVVLSGEAGMGKSRLAQALMDTLADQPHVRLRYQCSPHHVHSALYPLSSQIERRARFDPRDDAPARLRKLEAFLDPPPQRREEMVPLVAALLSIPTDGVYPALNLSPQRRKARTLAVIMEMLEREAQPAPLVLLVEDMHWIDPTSRELVQMIVDWARDARVLVIVTTRPGETDAWSDAPHVTTIALGRLDPRDCARLVPDVAGRSDLSPEMVERIVARAGGIPLFVEELTRSLAESGLLDADAEGRAAPGALEAAAIPATLQASLLARLDRLGRAKELAQVGAAIGRDFSQSLLAEVTGLPAERIEQDLAALVDARLVQKMLSEEDDRYAFRHALLQDAAYESLLRRRRQALHGRIAEAIESRTGGASGTQAAVLARHYTEAGIAERAVPYWLAAGHWAIERSADADAIAHLGRGIALLDGVADEEQRRRFELDLKILLTVPLTAVKGYVAPEVQALVTRARELCLEVDDPRKRFLSVHGLYRYHVVRADHRTAADYAHELLEMAEASGDPDARLEAHKSLALSLTLLGEFADARRHAEQAIALFDPERHRHHAFVYGTDPGVISYSYLGHSLWFMGHPDRALERVEQAAARGRTIAHPFSEAFGVLNAATLHMFRGDLQAMAATAREGAALAKEQGFPFWLGWAGTLLGYAQARGGDPAGGAALIQQTVDGFKAAGVGFGRPLQLAMLAEALALAGRARDALTVVHEGLTETAAEGYMWRAELFRLQGELQLAIGDAGDDAAEASFRHAVDLARAQRARSLELRAETSRARFLAARGRRREAADGLHAVHAGFDEGLGTHDLRESATLLDELARRTAHEGG